MNRKITIIIFSIIVITSIIFIYFDSIKIYKKSVEKDGLKLTLTVVKIGNHLKTTTELQNISNVEKEASSSTPCTKGAGIYMTKEFYTYYEETNSGGCISVIHVYKIKTKEKIIREQTFIQIQKPKEKITLSAGYGNLLIETKIK